MQRRRLAEWLVVGALAALGLIASAGLASAQEATPEATPAPAETADSSVQGSNSSEGSQATSAGVTAVSSASANAGPSANGGGGQSSQIGNNNVTVNQKTQAKSGDAVAGSQVTGVVGGNTTVQNQNSSTGAVATSGDVTVVNSATVNAGPSASGGGQAAQIGDNTVRVTQETVAASGSAVAGSQVTGIVGGLEDPIVQGQNSSTDADALSGDVVAVSAATVNVGPSASGDDAQAQQFGSNDAVIEQSTTVASGDAVAGSQVTGIVGGGESVVQNQNSSEGAVATSGNVTVVNASTVNVGPSANGAGAQAQQIGDNSAVVHQDVEVTSGDAVAGSQVTGLVSEERGHLTVQNQQSSDDAIATSGDVVAVLASAVNVGPSANSTGDGDAMAEQIGDNVADVDQHVVIGSGDAVAGSQVIGGVGGDDVTVQAQNSSDGATATSGEVVAVVDAEVNVGPSADAEDGEAMAAQIGDNDAVVSQHVEVTSGDAVAGSQVVGWGYTIRRRRRFTLTREKAAWTNILPALPIMIE